MGVQIRLFRRLPVGIRNFPLDVTFSLLLLPTSFLSLLGLTEPRTIAKLLPDGVNKAWSLVLLVGCISWLIGVLSAYEIEGEHYVVIPKVPVTVFGLWLVSVSSFVYGCSLIVVAGWVGLVSAMTMFVFAVGTTLRRISFMDR